MENMLIRQLTESFRDYLIAEEKSAATVEKYMRDVRMFAAFADCGELTKNLVVRYKKRLQYEYAPRSVNSMLASLNSFFAFIGREDLKVKTVKIQRRAYCTQESELTKGEYISLCRTAERRHNIRLSLILQTLCGTGIRISELQYITVEAARRGEAEVLCKAKNRTVFIVGELQKKLLRYAARHGIKAGMIFVTRTGKAMSRTNIWREMKSLCADAGVDPQKVFPHNLRHLFARVFYGIEKDIAKLADILGHASIDTTRIYIVSTGAEHRRKMENMHLIL